MAKRRVAWRNGFLHNPGDVTQHHVDKPLPSTQPEVKFIQKQAAF